MDVKPGYKRTEVGVIPEEWEVRRLGEVAEIVSGGTPRTGDASYWNGGIKWCTPTDITRYSGKYLTETERTISRAGLNNSGATMLPIGALLLCSRATIGEVKIAGVPICTNQGFKSLICLPEFDNEFMYYKLLTMKAQMVERAFGSTFLEISTRNVASLEFHAPPLPEQRAIAAALSDVDALLDGLDRRIAKQRDVKQAAMQQLLTGRTRLPGFRGEWEVKTLGDLGTWRGGMTPSMQNAAYWSGGDFPWISSGDVKHSRLSDTSQHVTLFAIRHGAAVVVPAGSIVLVTRSGILRRYLPVALLQRPMAINQDIKALTPNDSVSAQFLLHAISGLGSAILANCLKAGTTVESVEFPWLKAFAIALPPLPEQRAIAEALSDMDAALAALEARREKTRALKQAMMQELLTGRVRLV